MFYRKSGIFALIIYYVSIQNFDKNRITYYIFMNNIKILISAFLLVISQLGFSQTDTKMKKKRSLQCCCPFFTFINAYVKQIVQKENLKNIA